MVVDDLDVVGVAFRPPEADAPLIVDANAVLSLSIATERFQAVAWRRAQEIKGVSGVDQEQLSLGLSPNCEPLAGTPAREERLGRTVAEALDHCVILECETFNVKH